ncbi:MAG TPA: 3-hydroxyacyl-CoA dehydrogenase NAD-binding domain-containing protein [Candidatus Acidoferrales bacterium]|nr:3-hydroxyacyl-CoA dehydrogenase NAD-binding domain-containing protein [Candidatus Acidoferrales bacterium]
MEIKTVAIVGAGTMGRGIAYCSALAGYRTILEDVSESTLEQGLEYIRRALDEGISRGKVTEEQKKNSLACMATARSVQDACREADLIIEAVPEEMETKLEIFTVLDKFAKPGAIFASNTSSLSITEMAAITFHPENCIGMHFFNPVQKMKLLEIVRGLETSESALAACVEVGRRMGKEVVVVRESPGFVTSRINAMIGNEAFYMLQEGVATAGDIDKALKLGLNHPMGPFELVDLVGLDVRLSILQHLHRTLGEKYRPCPLLEQYVKAGRFGRKSGRGVYDYKEAAGNAKT